MRKVLLENNEDACNRNLLMSWKCQVLFHLQFSKTVGGGFLSLNASNQN